MAISSKSYKFTDQQFCIAFTLLCACCIVGFFISRALVSIASILLPILVIYQYGIKATWQQYWAFTWNRFAFLLLGFSALSFLWSEDVVSWQRDISNKLLLLCLPLGFSIKSINKFAFIKSIAVLLNIAICITIIRSVYLYVIDISSGTEEYMLDTTLYNDHIRFSFLISTTVLLNLFLLYEKKAFLNIAVKSGLIIASILGFLYLHLLSARTGLLAEYIALSIFFIVKAWSKNKLLSIGVIIGMCCIPIIATKVSPRLNEKVSFMIHEMTTVKDQDESVQYNYTDNNRILSYEAAWNSIKSNPVVGVGSGDLRNEMRKQYKELFPGIPEDGSLEVPHMQILSTSLAIGIPIGVLSILGIIFAPFCQMKRWKLYLFIHTILMLLFFSIDANLEIQFGLLIIVLVTQFWRILSDDTIIDLIHKKSEL
jgi:O-antigen ligase